jgi:BirA family biotin operon repressor/biotin-[acetyl-CoA-carboxylase] ligase
VVKRIANAESCCSDAFVTDPDVAARDAGTGGAGGVKAAGGRAALSPAAILAACHQGERLQLHVLDRVDSTSSEAMRLRRADGGSADGRSAHGSAPLLAVTAEYQSAGRGRRGRVWHGGHGEGIHLSVARAMSVQQPPGALALACSVAVLDVLHANGLHMVQLKWPNDLVHRDRHGYAKLGGLLVEASSAGRDAPLEVVVGVGINVTGSGTAAADATAEYRATDLSRLGLARPCRNALIGALIDALATALARYETDGFAAFAHDWNARDAFAGEVLRVEQHGQTGVGRSLGVGDDGALVLRQADGRRCRYFSGDVSMRPVE